MFQIVIGFLDRLKRRLGVYLKFISFRLSSKKQKNIVDEFHKFYYDASVLGKTWRNTFFLGIPTQKCPFDLFIYQEILYELKPDIIIETGTAFGGGALFLASICELMGHGEVVTIDLVDFKNKPEHKRIKYLLGSSVSDEIINQVKELISGKSRILVVLDSDHRKDYVLKELHLYRQFVSVGSYVIVEDSNVNGHPVNPEHGPGPLEAITEFVRDNDDFVVDKSREKHYLTFNPNGYLKKVKRQK